MKANIVKEKINKFASEGRAFLFAVDYQLENGLFVEEPLNQNEILFRTPHGSNVGHIKALNRTKNSLVANPDSFEEYNQKFNIVRDSLSSGNTSLVNLTIKSPIESSFTIEEIFWAATSPYSLYVPNQFVCFSPERFVKVVDGMISTNPMKGTINANIPNASEVILSNKKESEEHRDIVNLLTSELGSVADDISVARYRYIDRITVGERSILQVSSEIVGRLKTNYSQKIGDAIFELLPAGSISGVPKEASLEVIQKAEGQKRGYYTGVFGYFDGKVLDSAVLIRFIEQQQGQLYFRSGGGVTAESCAESEYKEALEKIYLPFV